MIPFVKYHGAGNDFVLLDVRHFNLPLEPSMIARRICQRRWGIGADGLLLLLSSPIADYRMRIFNADGSEPSMCGNGIRCIVDFLHKRCNSPSEITIETLHGVLKCRKMSNEIAVNLGPPAILHWPIDMAIGPAFVVNTGVPHAVVFIDDLDKIDIESLGRKIRNDPRFGPDGVNVNFVSVTQDKVALRTYERGVEGETLACGTGAAAAAYVAKEQLQLLSPISIWTRSSFETEKIQYQKQLRFLFSQSEIEMVGTAHVVFEGTLELPEGCHATFFVSD